jgi:hypothetical protein
MNMITPGRNERLCYFYRNNWAIIPGTTDNVPQSTKKNQDYEEYFTVKQFHIKYFKWLILFCYHENIFDTMNKVWP